jgi:hypothetical protein
VKRCFKTNVVYLGQDHSHDQGKAARLLYEEGKSVYVVREDPPHLNINDSITLILRSQVHTANLRISQPLGGSLATILMILPLCDTLGTFV